MEDLALVAEAVVLVHLHQANLVYLPECLIHIKRSYVAVERVSFVNGILIFFFRWRY